MESAIVVEAFRQSEDLQGVRYARLIADGDKIAAFTLKFWKGGSKN
mgnify:FL=1